MSAFKYHSTIIIDDNEIDNFIAEKVIYASHFSEKVYVHKNVISALEFIKKCESEKQEKLFPTCIFLDIDMPGWNGFRFLEELEKLDLNCIKETKIIVLSNSLNPSDTEKALSFKNVTGYLSKPIKIKDLEYL